MSQASSQAHTLYREVAKTGVLYALEVAEDELLTAETESGWPTLPFWSSRSRLERIQKYIPEYAEYVIVEISWEELCVNYMPVLVDGNYYVGLNWSGKQLTGYDISPKELHRFVEARRRKRDSGLDA